MRILGIPSQGDLPQAQLLGSVVRSEATRIEVDLDAPADLRGWGGAPVLEADGDRVLGLLQSAWPSGERMRIGVGPISGVVEALSQPFEGGLGRLFATLAPVPSAATGHGARRRAATGSPFGDQAPGKSAAEVLAAATRAEAVPRTLPPRSLQLEIEHPLADAIVGDAAGVFVAGRALALRGETRRFDIIIVDRHLGLDERPHRRRRGRGRRASECRSRERARAPPTSGARIPATRSWLPRWPPRRSSSADSTREAHASVW